MPRVLAEAFLLLVVSWSAATAAAEEDPDYPEDVSQWIAVTMPPASARGDRLVWQYAANYSPLEWRVRRSGDAVLASETDWDQREQSAVSALPFVPKAEGFAGATAVRKVSDGWLVASNRGEWGGSLHWFDASGKRSYLVSRHQVVEFFLVGDRLHAIEGLAHLSLSKGTVISLARNGLRWQATTTVVLPEAPNAVATAADGTPYIVLNDGLVALRDGRLDKVLEKTGWSWMHPNSAVFGRDGSLYVGMGQYVGRVRLDDKSLQFLIPDQKALNILPLGQEQGIRRQAGWAY